MKYAIAFIIACGFWFIPGVSEAVFSVFFDSSMGRLGSLYGFYKYVPIASGISVCVIIYWIDIAGGNTRFEQAEVVERVYTPASSGGGFSTDSSGDLGYVSTETRESYNLIVRQGSNVFSHAVTSAEWAAAVPGQVITIKIKYMASGKRRS